MFETLQMKRFHVHDQVEFKETKCVATALVDLFPRDSVVLTQHIKDTDEPKLEHPTPSSARTLKKTSMFEVDITPPKGKLITKKKKINKKCKDSTIPSPTPQRRILLHNMDSQHPGGDKRPPVESKKPKPIHSPPQEGSVSKLKGFNFASIATPSQKGVGISSTTHLQIDILFVKFSLNTIEYIIHLCRHRTSETS